MRRSGCRPFSPPACRCSWTRTGSRCSPSGLTCCRARHRRCSPRTLANSGDCSVPTPQTSRRGGSSTPGGPRQCSARRCCSRGPRPSSPRLTGWTRCSSTPRGRHGSPPRAPATSFPGWPARCSRRGRRRGLPARAGRPAGGRGGGRHRHRHTGAHRRVRRAQGAAGGFPHALTLVLMNSPAQALVDLDAISANVAALREHVAPSAVMAVVKADGYGHGAVAAARAAQRGGAQWLGVVHVAEALELRAAGIGGPLLCLMAIGTDAHVAAIEADVDLSAGSVDMVRRIAAAAADAGRPARLHLKADTGLSRGGATAADWPSVLDAALTAHAAGRVSVVGLWSHFASADEPGNPSVGEQLAAFGEALTAAEKAGVTPEVRHIAN